MKLHFISSLVFAVLVSLLTITDNMKTRMILLVFTLLAFYATLMLFAVDYEKNAQKAWKKKEKRLITDTYLKFFKDKE